MTKLNKQNGTSIPPAFLGNGPACPNLEWYRLSMGLLVRRIPQCTGWGDGGTMEWLEKWCEYFENYGFSTYS